MDANFGTGMVCECPGHGGGRYEHLDACGKPTRSDAHLCPECRLGKPLCWDSTCPAAPSYPHRWTAVCEEHAGAGR